MTTHLEWETINDWVDGALDPEQRVAARQHLDTCGACRERVSALESTLRETLAVPRELDPPGDVWPALRAVLEAQKVVALPAGSAAGRSYRGSRRRWTLAAAAVVLIVASSAITALVMRDREAGTQAVAAGDGATAPAPVWLAEAERQYVESARELSEALDVARPNLSAQTIAIVERNLAVIDSAIAESRAVLRRDPGNRVLLEVLAGTHRQKLDLLRRAAQLASS